MLFVPIRLMLISWICLPDSVDYIFKQRENIIVFSSLHIMIMIIFQNYKFCDALTHDKISQIALNPVQVHPRATFCPKENF